MFSVCVCYLPGFHLQFPLRIRAYSLSFVGIVVFATVFAYKTPRKLQLIELQSAVNTKPHTGEGSPQK